MKIVTAIIVPQKNVLHGGCGLSNIMKHSLQKGPECDEIFRDFFGFGARIPSDEAARGMGRKWGGKKLDSTRSFANKRKDRIATQIFFNKKFSCWQKTRGTRSDESLAL